MPDLLIVIVVKKSGLMEKTMETTVRFRVKGLGQGGPHLSKPRWQTQNRPYNNYCLLEIYLPAASKEKRNGRIDGLGFGPGSEMKEWIPFAATTTLGICRIFKYRAGEGLAQR